MFAEALSSAPNHTAASLVGEPRRKGCAKAARVWPIIATINFMSLSTKSSPLSALIAVPTAFNQAPKRTCREQRNDHAQVNGPFVTTMTQAANGFKNLLWEGCHIRIMGCYRFVPIKEF